ncbi:cupredoxin domain-containing protein [Streptomyces omiyaensis]|uniref:Cupredoxin domain-containing protein n=1 Tax=Streptomyces omiyaensis TaxID=68247 RepID=A0ABW7BUN7_9ACTN|nr:cupredoxin domain-containing protein [Streptomyces omiyaensis]GGY38660.1 metal-binding protein [Streptomyces omiyaensis]
MPIPPRFRRLQAVVAIAVLCMLIALAGCSGGSAPTSPSPSTPSTTSVSEERIVIEDFRFEPADLTVSPGAKVSVVNEDSAPHTVTAEAPSAFDTSTIEGGRTAMFTAPSTAGAYRYLCGIHPSMMGTLTVR